MANIFEINRPSNKITLGTIGTTINIASHTASKILALDASKNLEVVTIGSSLDYTRPTLNTIQDIRTSASPEWAGLLTTGKIKFTQIDGNEYIDSLADGYLDYSVTTAHRFNMSTANTDVRLEFIGTTNSGLIEWLEDEDAFKIHDDIFTDRWLGSDTNTFLGIDVAGSDNLAAGGIHNTAIGHEALQDITVGSENTCFGTAAGRNITTGIQNTAMGGLALDGITTGSYNVGIGYTTGAKANGDRCVFLGYKAGYHETGSNKLFIDNAIRTNEADGRVKALIYGVFAVATTNQSLRFNAGVTVTDGLTLTKTSGVGIKVDTATPTFGWADLQAEPSGINTGASKPTQATYRDTLKQFQFAAGDEEYYEYHIPHDYVPGTDIHIHVHWSHIGAFVTGGTITFTVESSYAKGHNQAPFSASVSGDFNGTASTTQYQHIVSETQLSASSPAGLQIDTDDLEPDGIIMMRILVKTNGITVSEGAVPNPFIHHADVHYQTTGLIGTKQKAPDFYT